MKGYFSTKAKDDFQAGFERGKADESPFRFILTIRSDDLDKMIADPAHLARMTGTVEAPALSPKPLTVTHGEFNLFVENPDRIGMKNMVSYRMRLTDEEGKQYYFHGYKIVRDDRRLDLRPDTTLYIKVHSGDSEAGPRGRLRHSAHRADGLRASDDHDEGFERAEPARGPRRGGSLRQAVRGRSLRYLRRRRRPQSRSRPQRRSQEAPDAAHGRSRVHTFRTQDGVEPRPTRYEGGNKGPVDPGLRIRQQRAVLRLDTTDQRVSQSTCSPTATTSGSSTAARARSCPLPRRTTTRTTSSG